MEISLIAALTADGFIARDHSKPSTSWTSHEDKKFFRQKTRGHVIVMGSTTYNTIGKPLPHRLNIIYTRKPKKVKNINLRYTNKSPQGLISELKKQDHKKVYISGGSSIYTMFLKSGLVTKLFLTIEPIFFGTGVKLLNEKVNIKPSLYKTHKLSSQTIVLEYDITK